MADEPKNPEKKLIIDEDWKSQVEAEKEAARQTAEAEKPAARRPVARRPRPAAPGRPHLPGEHPLSARSDVPGPAAQPRDQQGRRATRSSQALDRPADDAPGEDRGQPHAARERRVGSRLARTAADVRAASTKNEEAKNEEVLRQRSSLPHSLLRHFLVEKAPCPVRDRMGGRIVRPKERPILGNLQLPPGDTAGF